jgi:orotidine-5'-phosphate decarboxylase
MAEVVVALDMASLPEASRLLDRLPTARWAKVGSVLFTRSGPAVVQECRSRGLAVFLDLKWHDIPNTVAGAVRSARDLGVAMATVHTLGGREMLAAAAEAAGNDLLIVGVTVLTSHSAESYGEVVGAEVTDLGGTVARLAGLARGAGLAGVVCSPQELVPVRRAFPGAAALVVPGIRGSSEAKGDQVRVASAGDAARSGATHLVVGRPILQAADPGKVLAALQAEAGG